MTNLQNISVQKLIKELQVEEISFKEDDEQIDVTDYDGKKTGTRNLENVVFEFNGITVKICFNI